MRITEWELNHALHVFFRHSREHMLIFQDPDLHTYVDRHLIPLTNAITDKSVRRRGALTRRNTLISVDPQKFRPDAVLLDRNGKCHILEAKLGRINAVAECLSVVVQGLLYADLVLAPRWRFDDHPGDTLEFLEDIHEAFWFMKITEKSFGKYLQLNNHHQRHFHLTRALPKENFKSTPSVVFLLEDVNIVRLKDACNAVRGFSNFDDFARYAKQNLRESNSFQNRLKWLKNEWGKLNKTDFGIMHLDTGKLSSVIEGTILPL